jgi:hypothetical protein
MERKHHDHKNRFKKDHKYDPIRSKPGRLSARDRQHRTNNDDKSQGFPNEMKSMTIAEIKEEIEQSKATRKRANETIEMMRSHYI